MFIDFVFDVLRMESIARSRWYHHRVQLSMCRLFLECCSLIGWRKHQRNKKYFMTCSHV
jgi:hypothetical protein